VARRKRSEPKPAEPITSVVCLWKLDPEAIKKHHTCPWKLIETILLHKNEPLGKPKSVSGRSYCWLEWVEKSSHKDNEYADLMGRLITGWNLQDGVQLLEWTPSQWEPWLSDHFYGNLKQERRWVKELAGGDILYHRTVSQVRELLAIHKV
jgi:hypothetical protein